MIQQTMASLRPESPRAADWERVFGDTTIPLASPLPVRASLPIGDRDVYLVDVPKLDEGQVERLVGHLSAKFGLSRSEVREGLLHGEGLPILAEDVVVSFDVRLAL